MLTFIQFIKERYFAFVPFGKELKNVINEIINEFQELGKLPSIKYLIDGLQVLYSKIKNTWNYLEIRTKLEQGLRFAYVKLKDMSQTALEAESKYREAKTKFIYNPRDGEVILEQKLPISWHAFNQTPEFQEIPEFKAIVDVGLYFRESNTTFWTLYYQIKPLTEPCNWLPPYKGKIKFYIITKIK